MAQTPQEKEILAVTQVQRISRVGNIVEVMRVEYRIGDHGPFFVELPKAEFTTDRVHAEIDKIAATIRSL